MGRRTVALVFQTVDIFVRGWLSTTPLAGMANLGEPPRSLQRLVDEHAAGLSLGQIDLYVIERTRPNIVPIGRNEGVIVVTTGLVDLLNDDALEAVIVHALAHIVNRHGRRFGLALGLVVSMAVVTSRQAPRPFNSLAAFGVLFVGALVLTGISRRSVARADRIVIEHLGDPTGLAKAIVTLRTGANDIDLDEYEPAPPDLTERLFGLYPPHDDRIRQLVS